MPWFGPSLSFGLGLGFTRSDALRQVSRGSALVSSMQNAKNCADVRAWSQRRDFSREVLCVTVSFFLGSIV